MPGDEKVLAKDLDRVEMTDTPMGKIYVAIGDKAMSKMKSSKQLLGTWTLTKCEKVDPLELEAGIYTDRGVAPEIYEFIVGPRKMMKHIDPENSDKMKSAHKWFKNLIQVLYKDYDNQGGSIFEYRGPRIDH